MRVPWLAMAYGGLAGFFALEAMFREGGTAASLDASPDDQGTTRQIVITYVAAAVATPIVGRLPGPRLPGIAGPIGLATEVSGLALRAWSMRTLGRAYSRTLRTDDTPAVVEAGPYRLIRHPGYLGSILTWSGFALTSRSFGAGAVVASLLTRAYGRRIKAEEALLDRDLAGYREYRERTWALIPRVW
jgi:protein-S-isoprenylcysteine O-methyltransferase Ste14